jgi:hypothetical protein
LRGGFAAFCLCFLAHLLALLADEQFGAAHEVDEEHVADLHLYLFLKSVAILI